MAEPLTSAATLLTTTSQMVRQVYHDGFPEMAARFGRINKIIQLSKRRIDGDGITVQVVDKNMNAARMGTDLNGTFPSPGTFGANSYKATVSETAASNDFRRLALSLRTTWTDMQRRCTNDVAAADFIKTLVSQSAANLDESLALHRQLDSTAKIGTITGTVKKNDNVLLSSASAYTTSGGARFALSGGSIAAVPRGIRLDIYLTTVKKYTVEVTDYNPADNSVGVWGIDTDNVAKSTVDINTTYTITSGNNLYLSGEYNAGLKGIGNWFTDPASSGDSFYGNDRYLANYRWMLPHKSGPTSSRTFVKRDIDNFAIEMGYRVPDDDSGFAAITTLELEQRFRNEIGQDVLIQFPSSEQMGKLLAQYGFDGSLYRHPALGRITFQTDQFAPANTIRFLRAGDWEQLHLGDGTFQWLPGQNDSWYRVSGATASDGLTTVFQMDGLMALCDICTNPNRQGQIVNVTAT